MSFRCDSCKQVSHKPHRVVIERRDHVHPERHGTTDRGGVGTQIVREQDLCGECALRQRFHANEAGA